MTTTPQQIDRWRKATSEHRHLEFKEAKNQFDSRKLYEYCVAIANGGGGHLLLGVADKPPRHVVGTQAFQNSVKTEEKILQKLRFRVEIEEVNHPGGRVLVFHIPSRPGGTAYQVDGKYMTRAGSALVPMTEDQLRSIFSESPSDWNHPLSTEAAVASLKRYIADPRYQIRLSGLIEQTVEQIIEVTSGEAFKVQNALDPDRKSITARVRDYEAACSMLLAMATVGGRWAEAEHYRVWKRALQRLGWTSPTVGDDTLIGLKKYPATLLLYALGLGAVEADRLWFLGRLLGTTIRRKHLEDKAAVRYLPPFRMFSDVFPDDGGAMKKLLEGMDKRVAPLNDWIHDTLRSHAERIIPDDDRYTLVFDKLEILIALNYAHKTNLPPGSNHASPGAFEYRYINRDRIFQEIEESLSTLKAESPYVKSRIFGETFEECQQGLVPFKYFISSLHLF